MKIPGWRESRFTSKVVVLCVLAVVTLSAAVLTIGALSTSDQSDAWIDQFTKGNLSYEVSAYNAVRVMMCTEQGSEVSVPAYVENRGMQYKVIEIGAHVFYNKNYTKVILPDTIEFIHDSAFKGCSKLTYLKLPISVLHAPNRFDDCRMLSHVVLSKGPYNCPDFAGEMEYGTGLPVCLENALRNCRNTIKTIEIEPGVPYLGSNVFTNFSALESITIPEGVQTMGEYVFSGCSSLKEVIFKEGLRFTGKYAFKDCTSLTEVTLPDSLKGMGPGMFFRCTSLKTVNMPPIDISKYAFMNCTSLENIEIKEGTKVIGEMSFLACGALKTLNIPDSVTNIDYMAFSKVSDLTSVSIPINVRISTVGWPFESCHNVKEVTITPGSKDKYQSGYPAEGDDEGTFVLPGMLWRCSGNLEKVVVKEGVKALPEGLFQNCSKLKDVTLPSTLEKMGGGIFANCKSLTEIGIPSGITTLEYNVFWGCSKLDKVSLPKKTTTIGEGAFNGCSSLKNISIPDSVSTMGINAFAKCTNLEGLSIPISLNAVVKDKNPAFAECKKIQKIVFTPGTGSSHDYQNIKNSPWFISKNSLKTVVFSDGIETIGSNMFNSFSGSFELTLPSKLKEIHDDAFRSCKFIKSISLPSNLSTLGASVFEGCSKLTQVDFNNHLEMIGDYTFKNCTSLKEVIMPDSLKTVGMQSFNGCEGLTKIQFSSALSNIGVDAFKNMKFYDSQGILLSVDADSLKGCTFVGNHKKMEMMVAD